MKVDKYAGSHEGHAGIPANRSASYMLTAARDPDGRLKRRDMSAARYPNGRLKRQGTDAPAPVDAPTSPADASAFKGSPAEYPDIPTDAATPTEPAPVAPIETAPGENITEPTPGATTEPAPGEAKPWRCACGAGRHPTRANFCARGHGDHVRMRDISSNPRSRSTQFAPGQLAASSMGSMLPAPSCRPSSRTWRPKSMRSSPAASWTRAIATSPELYPPDRHHRHQCHPPGCRLIDGAFHTLTHRGV